MCGIAGLVLHKPGKIKKELISSFLYYLERRGPDDQGVLWWNKSGVKTNRYFEGQDETRVLLIHRRLSILDLSLMGWQPMGTTDGRYWIIHNGEIYNYLDLRRELEASGYVFRSRSDTEVLLAAWAEWGQEALKRLVGMFAFALLDTKERELYLVRDFFGIKPLYYTFFREGLAFASEIPPLLNLPGVGRRVNPDKLYRYLSFGRTDEGKETLFADVLQIPPAHYLRIKLDAETQPELSRYWELHLSQPLDISFAEATEKLRELFLKNVWLHLQSDVPVGATLSGGIDSSSIVGAVRYLKPDMQFHTFSFVADDEQVSEERYVDLVTEANGTVAHKVRISPEELVADLDDLVRVQGEPFGSTSIYAQYRVFRRAKEAGVKVLLDGQGADELLAGYVPYGATRVASLVAEGRWREAFRLLQALSHLPGRGKIWLYLLDKLLPSHLNYLARKIGGYDLAPDWLNKRWFLERGVNFTPLFQVGGLVKERLRKELLESLTRTSLPQLLRYEDRNSMAHSIESRVPFLTPALAEFILNLPEEYILDSNGVNKAVFRAAMRGLVPDAILDRKDKIGFATPEFRWLRFLVAWVEKHLNKEVLSSIPAVRTNFVQRDWQEILEGKRRFDFRVWRWINLVAWSKAFEVKYD